MKLVVLIAVPAAIGLIVLAEPLVATIFYGGVFTEFDVRMTALSLQAFSLGLVGFSFVKILAPAYFAREDTRTPVRFGLIALAVNFVLSVTLALTMQRAGYVGTHAGLALAISVAALVNAYLLYRGLRRDNIIRHSSGWGSLLFKFSAANIGMGVCLMALRRPLTWWLESGALSRTGWVLIDIAAGAAVYFSLLFILGVRPQTLRLRTN
jgi:putative peptidoglycan lipid II flippase